MQSPRLRVFCNDLSRRRASIRQQERKDRTMSWLRKLFGGREKPSAGASATRSPQPPAASGTAVSAAHKRAATAERKDVRCPACGHVGVYQKRVDHYVSLFFIPLFPIKRGAPFLMCDQCNTILDEQGARMDFEQVRGKSRCPSCGRSVDSGFSFCPHCGKAL